MSSFKHFLKYYTWIILLDTLAINVAYYLALRINLCLDPLFISNVEFYMDVFFKSAPFRTVSYLTAFSAFKLYGGAGSKEMKRILVASIVTGILHFVGMRLFIERMSIAFFLIGSLLQFLFIAMIRFFYRYVQLEHRKPEKRKDFSIPAMVVGSGEYGRRIVRHLEEKTPYRAVVIVGEGAGRNMDGIPVESLDSVEKQIKEKNIKAVFVADKDLNKEKREKIKLISQGLEFKDFTGYLNNENGFLPLANILEATNMPLQIEVEGKVTSFSSVDECLSAFPEEYEILQVQASKVILKKRQEDNNWMKEYQEQTGHEVSFFD